MDVWRRVHGLPDAAGPQMAPETSTQVRSRKPCSYDLMRTRAHRVYCTHPRHVAQHERPSSDQPCDQIPSEHSAGTAWPHHMIFILRVAHLNIFPLCVACAARENASCDDSCQPTQHHSTTPHTARSATASGCARWLATTTLPARASARSACASCRGRHLHSEAEAGLRGFRRLRAAADPSPAISWSRWTARAIKVTCDSSAEAEIASGSTAMKDTRFVRFICEEINRPCVGPTPHFIDNSAAHHLVRNVGVSARTKHFERWMHYLRDMYARQVASIHLVPDTCMVADIFTKPLYRAKFSWCRDYLLNR